MAGVAVLGYANLIYFYIEHHTPKHRSITDRLVFVLYAPQPRLLLNLVDFRKHFSA